MLNVKKIIVNFYLILAGVFIFLGYFVLFETKPADLELIFFNVGQGDAILIKTPGHYNILVDGGPDNSVLNKLGGYLPFWRRSLDLVILTHPDNDHLVGLVEVTRRYNVKAILLTGIFDNSPAYLNLLSLTKRKNIQTLVSGDVKRITIEPKINLEILYPFSSLAGKKFEEKNDSSIVANLTYKDFSVLLTGDAPQNIEKQIISAKLDLRADILKVAHHGSSASSGNDFLAAVKPELAIVCVGQNKFGHPSPAVLSRLQQLNIPFFSTLKNGDIIIFSDGQKFLRRLNP